MGNTVLFNAMTNGWPQADKDELAARVNGYVAGTSMSFVQALRKAWDETPAATQSETRWQTGGGQLVRLGMNGQYTPARPN